MHFHKWKEIFTGNGWAETIEVIYECQKCKKWKFVYESIQERTDLILIEATLALLKKKNGNDSKEISNYLC